METLKDRLAWAKERSGKNATQIAAEAGLDKSYVSKLLSGDRGGRLSAKYAEALGRVLDVDPAWLATGQENDPTDRQEMIGCSVKRRIPAATMNNLDEALESFDWPYELETMQVVAITDKLRTEFNQGAQGVARSWWLRRLEWLVEEALTKKTTKRA